MILSDGKKKIFELTPDVVRDTGKGMCVLFCEGSRQAVMSGLACDGENVIADRGEKL